MKNHEGITRESWTCPRGRATNATGEPCHTQPTPAVRFVTETASPWSHPSRSMPGNGFRLGSCPLGHMIVERDRSVCRASRVRGLDRRSRCLPANATLGRSARLARTIERPPSDSGLFPCAQDARTLRHASTAGSRRSATRTYHHSSCPLCWYDSSSGVDHPSLLGQIGVAQCPRRRRGSTAAVYYRLLDVPNQDER